jgi:2'-hydroxyisoflavone reductase
VAADHGVRRVLAPGDPGDPVQFIDVRDLGGWIIDGARRGLRGVFNVTGPAAGGGA